MEKYICFLVIIRVIYLKQMFINSLKTHSLLSNVLIFLIGIFLAASCGIQDSSPASYTPIVTSQIITPSAQISNTATPNDHPSTLDKWDLWVGSTQLRGANIWQRIVIPDLDGAEFLGSNYVGPPYTQEDFNRLASLGANYVNISGPGLFTEEPPYQLDLQVQAHLDQLLNMIQKADLFAVITFRTGPGRSDFTFYRDGAGDWFDPGLLREWVWTDLTAQDAWVEMWSYTASRYQGHPVVVGYDLMCEPNAAGIHGIWEPEDFYRDYAGTTLDWNQLYPKITLAIREVDLETPILIGGMGWSSVRWLGHLEPTGDSRTVYIVHQYEPQQEYTHQENHSPQNSYPGEFDLDWDGIPDSFNQIWLDNYLFAIDEFQDEWGMPVAVNEYGIVRWVPGGAKFLDDQLALFEERGLNHAIWMWDPYWEPWTSDVNAMNYRFGVKPGAKIEQMPNVLMDIIQKYWNLNTIRPSDFYPR
ncbi:MAG: hypothetical protein BA871_11010 [Desulfuromonadales bacterium C00003096]|jgi:hypothetical protein|nr:MAG: hypothetical protein BA871_11010 [Desulfuromonadales bacterium C00003096]